MKKLILVAAGICFSLAGWAQKFNIQSASNSLKEKDYPKAIEYIELALNDPSTKDDPKAWFTKGRIYLAMNDDPAMKGKGHYREAAQAFMKAQQLKANYEKETIDQALLVASYNYFNDVASAFNDKKYSQALEYSQAIVQIRNMDGGKKFANNKGFDTLASQAKLYGAYAAYYDNKYDAALPMLQELKNDPISKNENVYWLLAGAYKAQKNDAQYLATIEEGRAAFPNSTNLMNEEINYYIQSGKQDVYMKKLEDAVSKAPDNADYLFNLAIGFNNMAFPKDNTGKELPKPSNYSELVAKSEEAYKKALGLTPEHVDYNYNLGALLFNRGTVINEQMNNLGNTAADMKKYDELKGQRDALFNQALPYLEKTSALLEPKMGSLTKDDMFTYQSSLVATRQIYAIQDKLDKAKAVKVKLDALKK